MRSIKLCALVMALVSPHFIQANPGTYQIIDGYPPIYRPVDLSWTENSFFQTDGIQIITGSVENRRVQWAPEPWFERKGGYAVVQRTVIAGPGPAVGVLNSNALPILLRAFAKYVPVANETPTNADVKVLTAIGARAIIYNIDMMGSGSKTIDFCNRPDVFFSANVVPGGMKTTLGFSVVDQHPNYYSVGMVHDEELEISGSHTFEPGIGWVLRATYNPLELTSSISSLMGQDGSAQGSLLVFRAAKITWAGGTQLDSGWIPEDIDGDGEVGPSDFEILSKAFGSFMGDPNYKLFADIDRDGEIGPIDFTLFAAKMGETVTFILPHGHLTEDLGHW